MARLARCDAVYHNQLFTVYQMTTAWMASSAFRAPWLCSIDGLGARSLEFRMAARYVDQILKAAKPGDLPIKYPARYYLTLNADTAKSIGLTFPPMLLAQADRVLPEPLLTRRGRSRAFRSTTGATRPCSRSSASPAAHTVAARGHCAVPCPARINPLWRLLMLMLGANAATAFPACCDAVQASSGVSAIL